MRNRPTPPVLVRTIEAFSKIIANTDGSTGRQVPARIVMMTDEQDVAARAAAAQVPVFDDRVRHRPREVQ